VGQKIVPREEFWRLPPGEIHWLIEAHFPPEKRGETDEEKFDELLDLLNEAKKAESE
jgi:hypothetical protein